MKAKIRSSIRTVSALLLAFALVTAYAVPVNAASDTLQQEAHWYDSIPDMLAAGTYEEGVVIAGIDMSKAKTSGDPGSALESKKLRSGTEELMSVDPENALTDEEFNSWLKDHKGKLSEQNDGICITAIRRNDMTTAKILSLLASDESVVFAEPDYIINSEYEGDEAEASGEEPLSDAPAALDAAKMQWSSSDDSTFRAFGQQGNTSMNVPGWPDGSNMDHEIVVAVIDQAIDFSNPDLKDQAYTFTPEQQEILGCDEHGFNATWESEDGKLEIYPGSDHGMHVAGTIGASWDGHGVNGVGSNVKIVSIQVLRDDDKSSLINALRAMDFVLRANELGADIRLTNNSWGIYQDSKALDAAVTQLGKNGVVTVFAASNDGHDLTTNLNFVNTLTENPYAIIVGATDVSGNLADYSNYGNGVVTLAAPGTDILSCGKTNYIPFMANENKYYEDFENESTQLQIYQVDYETGEKISGTDGKIVAADETMGFEGSYVFEVPAKAEYADEEIGYARFCLDFSGVDGLEIDTSEGNTDYVGFAYGGIDEIELYSISGYRDWIYAYSHDNSWNINNGPFNKMEISPGPVITLTMDITFVDKVYFDTVGIGSERHSYTIKSGTSMACPAATGAAAVIASRHYDELTDMPAADSAERLAGLVRRSVRPMPALSGKVSTGGIIDLSVDEMAAGPEAEPAPDITDITISGREAVLTGSSFGSNEGTVAIRKYTAGNDPVEKESAVSAWSENTVEVLLNDDFSGIAEVEMTASNGKKDTFVKFISKSNNVFEKDHHFGTGTGETLVFDRPDNEHPELMGDMETSGIMVPLDGKVYYMPAAGLVEKCPAYRSLCCYDPAGDSWSSCPELPEWIAYASATAFDGKLYVKGSIAFADDDTGAVYYGFADDSELCVYSYTPGDSSWEKCYTEGVPYEYTLFNNGKRLLMAGAAFDWDTYEEYDAIMEYDPEKGAGEILCYLPEGFDNPVISCGDGCIMICRNDGLSCFVMNSDLTEETIRKITLPLKQGDPFTFAGNDDALMLAGPVSADGTSETYKYDPEKNEFTPYIKRVSDAAILGPASAVLDGRLYVIGGSDFEPDKRVFRSTQLKITRESINGTKVVLSKTKYTYNGKVRKPSIRTIGGKKLKAGTDYTVKWSNANPENVGTYTVTITGKGKYTGTTRAKYKIVPKGTSIKKLSKGKKAVTVSWKKQSAKMSKSRITGYQIQLATDKAFTKNKRTVTVKGYRKISKKVTKLKGRKKYYVRIRTYKTIKGVKYYSLWSKVKTVKTR